MRALIRNFRHPVRANALLETRRPLLDAGWRIVTGHKPERAERRRVRHRNGSGAGKWELAIQMDTGNLLVSRRLRLIAQVERSGAFADLGELIRVAVPVVINAVTSPEHGG